MQTLLDGITAGGIYALIALGFTIVYGTMRFFHFAHGGIYVVSAYSVFALLIFSDWPSVPSVLAGLIFGVVVGLLTERSVYRPLRHRNVPPLVLFMASLATLIVLQNLVSLVFGDQTRSFRPGDVRVGLELFGAHITLPQINIVVASIFLYVLTWFLISHTHYGKLTRAVACNPELARIIGIRVDEVAIFTLALGSALAAAAAILVAYDTGISPTMGFNALLMGVVAAIIGGVGSVPGAALGGLLLGLVQHFGVWQLSAEWQDPIAFVLLLLFLLFRPQGFFGTPLRKVSL